jgi:hypothetical protein
MNFFMTWKVGCGLFEIAWIVTFMHNLFSVIGKDKLAHLDKPNFACHLCMYMQDFDNITLG